MTLVSDTAGLVAGGPALPQERRVRTEVPGPRSRALLERQRATLPAGAGSLLPVFIEAAGGGVLVDADQNSFIDFGSGIAVTTVGNAAPKVVGLPPRSCGGSPTPASSPALTSRISRCVSG